MLELDTRAFYGAVNALQHMETVLAGRNSVREESDGSATITFINNPILLNSISENLNNLQRELVILGARLTLLELERLSDRLSATACTWEDLVTFAKSIRARLADELTLTKVLVIEVEKQNYYSPREPLFGMDFAAKFQKSGAFELDEAAKCLALGRPTAAAFHLMRIMEIGIRALARCLQIPDPVKPAERNWGHILKTIREAVEKKWSSAASRTSGEGPFFDEIYVSLDAVKNPWRNATMHIEKKYTDDEAEHVFVAVKGFMKKLAARCDENGLPRA